jgi:RimJ/RimL family protein N-acetyltransferase
MRHGHHRGTLCRVEDPPLSGAGDGRFTMRLRLEPAGPANAADLWLVHNDALRREFWGRGYAAEIGRAGLAFAFDVLGVQAVVSCTVRHNARSRAVMERVGMRYVGEIRSRGMVEGVDREQDDAPFTVCVLLRRDWDRPPATPVVA